MFEAEYNKFRRNMGVLLNHLQKIIEPPRVVTDLLMNVALQDKDVQCQYGYIDSDMEPD